MHTPEEAQTYEKLGEKYNLLLTGGSDYHGDKEETIGYYQNDQKIPTTYLEDFLIALK